MAPVTFVCDLCGAPGRAEAPGAAQCKTCGQVALVLASAPSPVPSPAQVPGPDPFEVARHEALGRGASDGVDLVLDDEVIEPPARLASLWVAPGRHGGQTPEPGTVPAFRRVRRGRRALAAVGALAASGALALGAAVAVGYIDLDGGDEDARQAAAPKRSAATLAAPSPAAEPRPVAPSRAGPAVRTNRASPPLAAPSGEPLPGLRVAASRNPVPVDRQCVPRALRERSDVVDRLPDEIRARFPVGASGAIGPVEVMGDVSDPEVTEAIEDAIRSCPFVPGADEEGRPISLSVVMRIRFAVQ